MSSLRLYDKPECPFCWKIRLALASNWRLDVRADRLRRSKPHAPNGRLLHPRKTVPVLVRDDLVIYESNVILEYLHDLTGRLLPKKPDARVQARLINAYSDNVIGAGLREVIFEKRGNPQAQWDMERIARGKAQFEAALGVSFRSAWG